MFARRIRPVSLCLLDAIMSSDPNEVRRVIEMGANVNEPHGCEYPFHLATSRGKLLIVHVLLEYGADVFLRDSPSSSLHWACMCLEKTYDNSYQIIQLLLERGLDCNERDPSGLTPFHAALQHGNLRIAQLLLSYGADVQAVNIYGMTALHYAARNYENVDVLAFILDLGFDIEQGDCLEDRSALQHAAWYANPKGCELLLKRGANLYRQSRVTGETALTLAVRCWFDAVEVVQLLLERGAEVTDLVEDYSVLQLSAVQGVPRKIRNALIQHIAKLQYLNLSVDEYDLQEIESIDCDKKYYEACLREFEKMKEIKFYNNVSILSILMESEHVLSGYARNEDLIEAFEKKDYGKMFPINLPTLKKRFYAQVYTEPENAQQCSGNYQ